MKEKLPDFFLERTKMNCLKDAINQSLNFAYTPHPAVNDYWEFCAFGQYILM
jgi:hypothetical protein